MTCLAEYLNVGMVAPKEIGKDDSGLTFRKAKNMEISW